MDTLKQLLCTVQVAVLFLISLHTSCALPMADNLNAVKTTSSKAALADNHTKIEAYDSIDLSDAMKSNAALQGLVRKYNETGINVVSLLYNQQMKNRRQQRNAPSCTRKPKIGTYTSPTTSCSSLYSYVECQPGSCVTGTGQSGCREVNREITLCGGERIQVPNDCTCSLS